MNKITGTQIKSLRENYNLSQEELGSLCGIGIETIRAIEDGKESDYSKVLKMFDVLNLKLDDTDAFSFPYSKEQILEILSSFKARQGKNLGIESLALYGSCARGEQKGSSDIDVAVKMEKPNLLKFCKICSEIEELFTVKVDVISLTAKFLTGFRENISKDLIYV